MKQRFSVLLVVFFFLFIVQWGNLSASAADNVTDFNVMNNSTGVTIKKYNGTDTDVVIPSTIDNKPVTEIWHSAFKDKGLISVTIPNTVTTIDYSAFENNKLKEVTIPSSVKIIKAFAFKNNELTNVTLHEGITEIESAAFSNNQLSNVTIPASVNVIGDCAFAANHLETVTFEGTLTLNESSFELIASDSVFGGWYTDKSYKNKWNNAVSAPMTIYGKWYTALAAKKLKIDNLGSSKIKFTNLEEDFTYTIYKDAERKQKLVSFQATSSEQTVTVKQFPKNAGDVYVVVSRFDFSSKGEKVKHNTERTNAFSKNNVTIKYDKKQSTIQLKNLKIGTTYAIFKDANQKVKIASFKADKTTKTIKTNKLSKKNGEVYITAQQPSYSVSNLAIACYPKEYLCPKSLLPSGATITEIGKDYVKFSYKKPLPGGGKITEVMAFKKSGEISVSFWGVDKKGESFYGKVYTTPNNKIMFQYAFYVPIITDEAMYTLIEVTDRFKESF